MQSPLLNRIKKNYKLLKPILLKEEISCYRLFDWDMPEYPLCIDIYENKIHVAEYKTRHTLDDFAYKNWLNECKNAILEFKPVAENDIFFKLRKKRNPFEQYEKVDTQKNVFQVEESKLKFLVNLNDYIDTGLFLDHRPLRKIVGQMAKQKFVLNLFAYTGSFSVYAAAAQATQVCTVDLSNTYLNWAKENFKLNQIPVARHQFIKADVKEWIKQIPSRLYDIIILDPPTISKSKMTISNFDVQADHVSLINNTLKHLHPDGVLFFSNNYRAFTLNKDAIQASSIKDISAQTIPFDFRNKKIHACWEIRK
ncbi:MAG: class I SAM-dependent methyltransferase [Chitinophagaceae bacterium]